MKYLNIFEVKKTHLRKHTCYRTIIKSKSVKRRQSCINYGHAHLCRSSGRRSLCVWHSLLRRSSCRIRDCQYRSCHSRAEPRWVNIHQYLKFKKSKKISKTMVKWSKSKRYTLMSHWLTSGWIGWGKISFIHRVQINWAYV